MGKPPGKSKWDIERVKGTYILFMQKPPVFTCQLHKRMCVSFLYTSCVPISPLSHREGQSYVVGDRTDGDGRERGVRLGFADETSRGRYRCRTVPEEALRSILPLSFGVTPASIAIRERSATATARRSATCWSCSRITSSFSRTRIVSTRTRAILNSTGAAGIGRRSRSPRSRSTGPRRWIKRYPDHLFLDRRGKSVS